MIEENNRLVTAGNRLSGRIMDALRLEWLRNLGADLRTLMQKTYSMNVAIFQAVISIQGLLPSHLERTLIQEPFILEDAIGRLSPVHLQFICSWEAFEDVLEHRFRGLQGHNMVRDRLWVIQEVATYRDISREIPWETAFLPGQRVGMDLIFRKQALSEEETGTTSCPNCKAPSTGRHNFGVKWSVQKRTRWTITN
jgi:hypothetical protein